MDPWLSVDSEGSTSMFSHTVHFLRGKCSILSWAPQENLPVLIWFSELLSWFHFLFQNLLVEQEPHRLVVFRTGDDPRLLGEKKILAGSVI